jgi:hypothetical protein
LRVPTLAHLTSLTYTLIQHQVFIFTTEAKAGIPETELTRWKKFSVTYVILLQSVFVVLRFLVFVSAVPAISIRIVRKSSVEICDIILL